LNDRGYSSVAYVLVLFPTVILLWFLSASTNIPYTEIEVVRDSIKTLLQMQATIIAIVISLSLATVQLATSAYSIRLFRSFSSNPWMWTMLVLYLASMSLNFWLLSVLFESSASTATTLPETINIYGNYITFSYALGFLTIFLLFPYLYSMTNILSPEKIIVNLVKKIKKSPALYSHNKYTRVGEDWEFAPKQPERFEANRWRVWREGLSGPELREEDPFQPINDIISTAVMKYDYKTAKTGLELMQKEVVSVIKSVDVESFVKSCDSNENPELRIRRDYEFIQSMMNTYCLHLSRLGKLFATKGEERLAFKITEILWELGVELSEKALHIRTNVLPSLRRIGLESVEAKMKDATDNALYSLTAIAKVIRYDASVMRIEWNRNVEKFEIVDTHPEPLELEIIVSVISEVGRKAVGIWGLDGLTYVSSGFRVAVEMKATKGIEGHGLCTTIREFFGIATNMLENSTLGKLENLSKHVFDSGLNNFVTRNLIYEGIVSHENGIKGGVEVAAEGLWDIGIMATEKTLPFTAEWCADGLGALATLNQNEVDEGLSYLKFRKKGIESTKYFKKFRELYFVRLKKELEFKKSKGLDEESWINAMKKRF